ncbi:MAG: hypothetical protein NT075_10405 [Chloroflexi bacterium]|nr:hypothetical protein [Chloroflexota bacterium]
MSTQSARNPTDLGLTPTAQFSQVKNLRDEDPNAGAKTPGNMPGGESPELLRWRADMLMDEMMLGAVDVYAGEPKTASVPAGPSLYQPRDGYQTDAHDERSVSPRASYENGRNGGHHGPETQTVNGYSANGYRQNAPQENAYSENGRTDGSTSRPLATAAPTPTESEVSPAKKESQTGQPRHPGPVEPPARETKSWVFSAEARYQQIARSQNTESASQSPANFTSAIPVPTSAQPWMAAESAANLMIPSEFAQSGQAQNGYAATNGSHGPELGPVRRTVPQVTNAMAMPVHGAPASASGVGAQSVPNRNGKWSNLLPRVSTTDLQTLQQEITTLHSEINAILPASHESNQRSQHLLEKAQAILENDPMRSAEVEYYLQQVRTIFQRVQQTIHWSNLYRNRLLVYLTGWSVLAAIVLLARYMYQPQMENWVIALGNWATDSFAAQNFAAWISTLSAGALGGALGTLINLRLRSRLEYGFFDRKYGLRGLILPVMGALFGFVLYLFVGLIFYLLEFNPSINMALSTLPALIAFIFGISQESIYGTRR